MNDAPLGHPENPLTQRAPIDAILLAQAFYREDLAAGQVIINNCDLGSVALQLCGWVYTGIREAGDDVEDRLATWLKTVRAQTGEDQ